MFTAKVSILIFIILLNSIIDESESRLRKPLLNGSIFGKRNGASEEGNLI